MDYSIKDVAERLKGLRESSDISIDEVCKRTSTSIEDYVKIESGEKDFSVSFIYKCAEVFGVDLIEILTGQNPKLNKCSIVRKGKGLPIERRAGFSYQHLAYLFKDKGIEPLIVDAPFEPDEQDKPITLSVHDGQEFDYIIEGSLKCVFGGQIEVLNAGDAVYYDSTTPHGMIATNNAQCKFMAILVKK
ncbi:MAG: cupin domain-containing protein [Oscillospiraceae bacterium]